MLKAFLKFLGATKVQQNKLPMNEKLLGGGIHKQQAVPGNKIFITI